MQRGEKKVNSNLLELDNGLADDEREEAVGMLEESSSGIVIATNLPCNDEASENDDSSTNLDSSNPLRVILYISVLPFWQLRVYYFISCSMAWKSRSNNMQLYKSTCWKKLPSWTS